MFRFLLILFLFSKVNAEDLKLKIEYERTKQGYVFMINNISQEDVLIRDIENSLLIAFGQDAHLFERGKKWTYLRKKGSGFASDGIILNLAIDKLPNDEKIIGCKIDIAIFHNAKRTISAWGKIEIRIQPLKKKAKRSDAALK